MSYMSNAEFANSGLEAIDLRKGGGIQELSFDEIQTVNGGELSNLEAGALFVGIGIAAVAAAPFLGAGAVATFGIALGGRALVVGGGFLIAAALK